MTPATRAVLVCNPNNPTGARFDATALDAICRIAASVGAWVISDEIYRGAERYLETRRPSGDATSRPSCPSGLSKA